MKSRLRALAVVAGTLAVLSGSLVSANPAMAATPPEPDPTNQLGTISFLDASGAPVTGGLISAKPNAEYAVASTDDPQTANVKAALYGYAAKSGTAPGAWGGEQISSATSFPNPNPSGPAAVTGTTHPVVWLNKPVTSGTGTGPAQYISFAQLQTDFSNAGDPYAGVYQLRIKTANNTKWWAADIQITGNNWQQIFPAPPMKTLPTVSLSASPTGSAYKGQTVTFTATVSNGGAGTVSFADSGTPISACTAQPVTNGAATCSTSGLRAGTRSLVATYTPTDTATYQSAQSGTLSYTVKDRPFISAVAINGTPRVGQTLSCQSSSDDPAARVSYRWYRNSTKQAAGQTYALTVDDYNTVVFCTADYVNGAGSSTAESNQVGIGVGPNLSIVRLPRFRAALISGKRAYVLNGSYSPSATGYAYQWYLNGRAVRGATRSYFTVPRKSRGKVVAVRVVARRYAYGDAVVVIKAKVRK